MLGLSSITEYDIWILEKRKYGRKPLTYICHGTLVGPICPPDLLTHHCQKRGVAYPRLPYLRQDEPMLLDVRIQLVIRPEVTTNG